jgi:hypothetical protein
MAGVLLLMFQWSADGLAWFCCSRCLTYCCRWLELVAAAQKSDRLSCCFACQSTNICYLEFKVIALHIVLLLLLLLLLQVARGWRPQHRRRAD